MLGSTEYIDGDGNSIYINHAYLYVKMEEYSMNSLLSVTGQHILEYRFEKSEEAIQRNNLREENERKKEEEKEKKEEEKSQQRDNDL